VQFKVALCQLSVTADKARNISHARAAIEAAAAKGAKLVLLPVSPGQVFFLAIICSLVLLVLCSCLVDFAVE
jgi:hypothetical protein